ncbi:MAG TPA: hypothetical protein PLJ47_16815 [Candidatus Hydrogenedentes bacterium]|nr:hypothetical protein [Candidatus Hydrogenedentota bacterium]
MVRGKFIVTSHKLHNNTDARTVYLSAVHGSDVPEDVNFAKYTPSGQIEMYIDNPSAVAQLEIGKAFYVDFMAVPEI